MPLAKALCEGMGGELTMSSSPGERTTVTVVIGKVRIIEVD